MTEAHHILGASTFERTWHCAGWPELAAKSPPDKPTSYAAEGTVAHWIASQMLLNKTHQINMLPVIGLVKEQDGFKIEVTQEMLTAVFVYETYIRKIIEKYKPHPEWVGIEKRVTIPVPSTSYKTLFGTADAIIHVPYTKLYVSDYKHGKGVKVSAFGNKQLMFYALGAYLEIPKWFRSEIPEIEMSIVQPRAPRGGIDTFTCSPQMLEEFHEGLIKAVERVKPGAPRVPGSWCKFCPAKSNCFEYKFENTGGIIQSVDEYMLEI